MTVRTQICWQCASEDDSGNTGMLTVWEWWWQWQHRYVDSARVIVTTGLVDSAVASSLLVWSTPHTDLTSSRWLSGDVVTVCPFHYSTRLALWADSFYTSESFQPLAKYSLRFCADLLFCRQDFLNLKQVDVIIPSRFLLQHRYASFFAALRHRNDKLFWMSLTLWSLSSSKWC
jgi:hypothetical protein